MKRIALALLIPIFVTGCGSLTKAYVPLKESTLSPDKENDGAFDTLLTEIGAHRATLTNKAAIWTQAEAGFGVAVLAAAAYGAFNSVYGGSNLKDAAFAAASIGALRSYSSPTERRNALLAASDALNCLYKHGSVFKGPASSQMTNLVSSARGGASSIAAVSTTFSLSSSFAAPSLLPFDTTKTYPGTDANTIFARNLGLQRLQDRMEVAAVGIVAAAETEEKIHSQRFMIVSTKYVSIVNTLLEEMKYEIPDYQAALGDLKKAAETAAKSKMQAEGVALFSAVNPGVSLSNVEEELQKYAQAKADIQACGS